MNASRLLLLSIVLTPAILPGQKKEDILSIQRDVASLDDHVKQLQKALDEKTAALTALLQQSIEASNKNTAALQAMQHSIDQKLADQQGKLVAPVASLGTKIEEMSGDFRSVRENVAELVRRMNDLDGKVAEISTVVRTLNTPAAVPAPPPAAGGSAAAVPEPAPPMSAELMYTGALTDFNLKKDDTALTKFSDYLRYYGTTSNAPNAQYYIGQIYYRAEAWPDAVKAFDAVLETYPKNPKTAESQYMKACALMKGKQKTAAVREFKNLIEKYPESPRVKDAHAHLRELGMEGSPSSRRKG
jgi:TolA-binding protein